MPTQTSHYKTPRGPHLGWWLAAVAAFGWSALGAAPETAPEATPEPSAITYEGEYFDDSAGQLAPSIRAENPDEKGNLYNINMVVVVGDREEVIGLPNWEHYVNEALYQPMADADIEAFRQRVLKDLQEKGFIFATVSIYKPSLVQGFLKLRVHVGQLGKVTVRGNRFQSAEQILKKVEWTTGSEFDYNTLFNRLYAINTTPGIEVTSQLRPRQEEGGRRVIDAEFTVKERWPLTGALIVSNDGAREGGDWRMRGSLQWLNPLKQDDVLGIEVAASPEDLNRSGAFSASYVLPLSEETKLSAFGGYSKSDLQNVLPQLDLVGQGYFMGGGVHQVLWESSRAVIEGSAGWMFLNTQNRIELPSGYNEYQSDLSMPRLSVSYSSKEYDSLGGRNFVSNTIMFNFEGTLGSSDQAEFANFNHNTDGNFFIDRLQFARFQKLYGDPDKIGSFTLFTRFDGQIATDALPSSVQKSIGGADSVRGYLESEFAGDMGYDLSIEVRTPLLENFIVGLQKSEEFLKQNPQYWGIHRLQALVFFDYGAVAYKHGSGLSGSGNLPGQSKASSIFSVGAGLRMGLTRFSQFRLDYGFPLKSTPERPQNGRLHFSGQLQF